MQTSACELETLIDKKLFRVRPPGSSQKTKARALLFVHGFLGDATNTWIARGATESFPALLATDSEVQDYEVFLFQYVTADFHPPAITSIADQLNFAVQTHLHHDRLILLGHSMGGLVCMRFIVKLLEEGASKGQSIGGLLLYGVPMTGIEWAKYARLVLQLGQIKIPLLGVLARLISSNKQVEALTSGSEFIDRLNGKWVLRALNGGHPDVPPENRVWFPVRVVSGNDDWVVKESSARGFYAQRDWINADEDHRALVKPKDRLQMTYQVARRFLVDCRVWMNSQSLLKLRRQLDSISDVHRRKCISDWEFELKFDAAQTHTQAKGFGLSGFRSFCVARCSYRFVLQQSYVRFGFAAGAIAGGAVMRDEFAFLHRVRFGGLPQAVADPIRKRLQEVVEEGSEGWNRLFENLNLEIRAPRGDVSYQLEEQPVENVSDVLIRKFVLPEAAFNLLGQEVEINVSFRSLLPVPITDYTVMFPWLCDRFVVRIFVGGNPSYLVESQAMRGTPVIESKREGSNKMEFSSKDLILPESYIRLEWQYKGRESR